MEIIANALQTVPANQDVYFTNTVVGGSMSISHRNDSGLITLRGNTNQQRARFRVTFGGNIAIPATGTAGPISLVIAFEGEGLTPTTMTVTPAAVSEFFNVSASTFIDVLRGCCVTISVKNISNVPIEVMNANLIVERVA